MNMVDFQVALRPAKRRVGSGHNYIVGTPLHYCIEQFGGMLAFCRAIEKSTRQIYRWRDGMGTGAPGMISAPAQTEALIAAKRLGIELDPVRLVYMPAVVAAAQAEDEDEAPL